MNSGLGMPDWGNKPREPVLTCGMANLRKVVRDRIPTWAAAVFAGCRVAPVHHHAVAFSTQEWLDFHSHTEQSSHCLKDNREHAQQYRCPFKLTRNVRQTEQTKGHLSGLNGLRLSISRDRKDWALTKRRPADQLGTP